MRRKLKRATNIGWRSRAFRCRVERLESRSMLAADCGQAVIEVLPDDVMPGDTLPDEVVTRFALSDDVTWCGAGPAGACDGMDVDALQFDAVPLDTGSWVEWQSFEPADLEPQPWEAFDPVSEDAGWDDSWSGGCWSDDSWLMAVDPTDVRTRFVWSEAGWASYSYFVGLDGSVTDISVVASYDEPAVAAFVAEHRDDGTVQIEDLGDCWWIDGFPADLAPPVPEYRGSFFAACGGGFGMDAAEGAAEAVETFDVNAEWSWQGGSADATKDYGSYEVEQAFGMPLFYARGSVLPEEAMNEAVAEEGPWFTADVAAVASDIADTSAAAAAAIDPRAAAFADMRMMVAAATMLQGVTEATTFGGGRRRR